MFLRKRIDSARRLCLGVLFTALLLSGTARAATWYVAPTGSDTNTGNITAPFATIMRAQTAASTGDTVYLRGGTYSLTNSQITNSDASYYYVNYLNKKGISYIAYPGEDPVFDFTNVKPSSMPTNLRVCAFLLVSGGGNITLQGFEIVGVQITIPTVHTQSECIRIESSNNTLRYLKMHDGMGIGVYIVKNSANNLVENCDAYNNTGLDSGSIGNIDGFGCHVNAGYAGNVFRYDRSWANSDDGYDCINCATSVTFDHCWSYYNGWQGGDGNGFKSGGWGSTAQNAIPDPVPNHVVKYCLSAGNKAHGYYANHQPGQSATWTYNTSYNNSVDFDMLERNPPDYTSTVDQTDANDTAGVYEVMHYNIGYDARDGETGDLNESGNIVSNNSWTLPVTVNSADFQSANVTQMTLPRQADGSLPVLTFMHLVSGSDCAGLGCFESAPLNPAASAASSKVTLTWTSVLGAVGYTVSRSTTSGGNYTAVSGNLSTTIYADTSVTNGVTYYYVVTATNGEDTSSNSTEVSATPLAAPTGLLVTPGNGNVSLSWTGSTGASNYTVERSTTSGSGYVTIATNVSSTTYKDTTAANGTTYYYVVVAANSSGSSGTSAQASGTPEPPAPPAPTGLAATPGNGNVSLTWTAASGATGYLVQRSTTSGSGYALIASGVTATTYTDSGLTNGATYYYVVSASNAGGTSSNSTEVSATPAQTLTQWASTAFPGQTDPAVIGPMANPSGDGIPNLLKYFYGLSPATNAGSAPVTTSPDNSGNEVLTFRLAKNLTGVTYQIQESTDLTNWSNTGVSGTVVSDEGTYYLMQAAVPLGANAHLYLRVAVTQAD